jgi:hypothetical protein
MEPPQIAIWHAGRPTVAVAYTAVLVAQYATSLDRVGWLLRQ